MRDEFTDSRRTREEPHTSPEITNTRCDMCPDMSCILQERSRLHPYRYYCHALSRTLSLKEVYAMTRDECPRHRELKRRRFEP